MNKRAFMLLAMLAITAGCSSGGNNAQSNAASPAPAVTNTTGFPLYTGSHIVSTHDYTQRVQLQNAQNSVFTGGNGTYSGSEIFASTQASLGELSSWLTHLTQAPPSGFTALETGTNPSQRAQAQAYGVDYATFETKQGGKTRGLLVVVLDPQRVDEKLGRIIGMVAKYRALPGVMRAPIDNEAKSRFGMTVTQATDPQSPIGAALAALGEFQQKDSRGIVVIDAVKR